MNIKLTQQFGEEILSYRIKSKRRKKRDQKKQEKRKLIRLNRELDQIRNKQRNLGYIDLCPPIVRGWKRYFVLREDVFRSKHGLFYQKILNKINTTQYSWRKDFKKKKHKGGKKNWIIREQRLLELNELEFAKAKFSDKEAVLFDEKHVMREWRKEPVKVFVFKEPWRFVLRMRANLITKVKAVDIELEKREKEIRDYLDWNGKIGTFCRLIWGSHKNGWGSSYNKKWCNKPIPKYRFKQKSLQEFLHEEYDNL